jgi:type II secretory pathway pseudopilin PulG
LIEMLVVIAILGILAGLAVPALKDLGKSNSGLGASRQLLDDVGRARQLAMSQRTTVYMVFVPTNFWNYITGPALSATNYLCDKQLTGYAFIGQGTVGDQPGRHSWHYLAPWQNLPDGTFIAQQKFSEQTSQFYTITDLSTTPSTPYYIYGFSVTNDIPFPTETNVAATSLPYIAFNSSGQLVSGQDPNGENIPLAKGAVLPAIDLTAGTGIYITNSPQVSESPAGNSTSPSYNIIHIDRLTGRAVLEFQKVR